MMKMMMSIQINNQHRSNSVSQLQIQNEDQLPLSKPIIRPWEEIGTKSIELGIGYEKDVTFHNMDYTKLIQFLECWTASRKFTFTYSSSRADSDMPTLSASWPHGRSVLRSSSL
jgi:hypothetical protein